MVQDALDANGITLNKNCVQNEKRSPIINGKVTNPDEAADIVSKYRQWFDGMKTSAVEAGITGATAIDKIKQATVKRKPGMEQVDVLVDGEYIDELKSPDKHWVGSSNQNVIDVKVSIRENKLVLWKEG